MIPCIPSLYRTSFLLQAVRQRFKAPLDRRLAIASRYPHRSPNPRKARLDGIRRQPRSPRKLARTQAMKGCFFWARFQAVRRTGIDAQQLPQDLLLLRFGF